MNSKNKEYLDEYIYDYIDDLCDSSDKYKQLSENLKDRLSELFDSIEDEDCDEILCDIDEINKYLIKLYSLSTNELTMIKNNGKKLIEKHMKQKEKIQSLKTQNNILEEELTTISEQKENALLKIDEINDEYYKLYQEKNNLELQISIKENEETQKHKLNNELLNDEIKSLNNKIEYLNKQLKSSEEKNNNLSQKSRELLDSNSQMKKEIKCKDELLKMSMEKFNKINEEKEKIRIMNRGLQKTIEELRNQCADFQTVNNYNEEQIKLLKEKISRIENLKARKKVSFKSLKAFEEEGDINKPKNKNINNEKGEKETKKEKDKEKDKEIEKDKEKIEKDKGKEMEKIEEEKNNEEDEFEINGKEINLNELIFDESESADHEVIDKKKQIKLAFTRVKSVRRFNRLKSLNYHNKQLIVEENNNRKAKPKKTVIEKGWKLKNMDDSYEDMNGRLETIMTEKSDFESTNILFKLKKKNNDKIEKEDEDIFLYELLFRFLD